MKLRSITGVQLDKIPDHILQEVVDLALEMGEAVMPLINRRSPNITLAACAFMHSAMIKKCVIDDETQLRNAANLSAFSLVSNLERLMSKDE